MRLQIGLNLLTGHGNKSGKPLSGDAASSASEGSSPCSPLQQDSQRTLSGISKLEASVGNRVQSASSVNGLLQHVDNVSAVTCSFRKLAVAGSSITCYKCRAKFHADPTCVCIYEGYKLHM